MENDLFNSPRLALIWYALILNGLKTITLTPHIMVDTTAQCHGACRICARWSYRLNIASRAMVIWSLIMILLIFMRDLAVFRKNYGYQCKRWWGFYAQRKFTKACSLTQRNTIMRRNLKSTPVNQPSPRIQRPKRENKAGLKILD